MTYIAPSLRKIRCLYFSHSSDYRLALAVGGFCSKKQLDPFSSFDTPKTVCCRQQ